VQSTGDLRDGEGRSKNPLPTSKSTVLGPRSSSPLQSMSPLHLAAHAGRLDLIALMLQAVQGYQEQHQGAHADVLDREQATTNTNKEKKQDVRVSIDEQTLPSGTEHRTAGEDEDQQKEEEHEDQERQRRRRRRSEPGDGWVMLERSASMLSDHLSSAANLDSAAESSSSVASPAVPPTSAATTGAGTPPQLPPRVHTQSLRTLEALARKRLQTRAGLEAGAAAQNRKPHTQQPSSRLLSASSPAGSSTCSSACAPLDVAWVLDARDHIHWTPLHCACATGQLSTCAYLLACGASAQALTRDQSTPLHYLVRCHESNGEQQRPKLESSGARAPRHRSAAATTQKVAAPRPTPLSVASTAATSAFESARSPPPPSGDERSDREESKEEQEREKEKEKDGDEEEEEAEEEEDTEPHATGGTPQHQPLDDGWSHAVEGAAVREEPAGSATSPSDPVSLNTLRADQVDREKPHEKQKHSNTNTMTTETHNSTQENSDSSSSSSSSSDNFTTTTAATTTTSTADDGEAEETPASALLRTISLLLDAGCPVNQRNRHGETALHACCRHNPDPDVALLLLSRGADINSQSNSSETPLHAAVWAGHTRVAAVLLQLGARIGVSGPLGNALDLARSRGHLQLFHVLLLHGERIGHHWRLDSRAVAHWKLQQLCGPANMPPSQRRARLLRQLALRGSLVVDSTTSPSSSSVHPPANRTTGQQRGHLYDLFFTLHAAARSLPTFTVAGHERERHQAEQELEVALRRIDHMRSKLNDKTDHDEQLGGRHRLSAVARGLSAQTVEHVKRPDRIRAEQSLRTAPILLASEIQFDTANPTWAPFEDAACSEWGSLESFHVCVWSLCSREPLRDHALRSVFVPGLCQENQVPSSAAQERLLRMQDQDGQSLCQLILHQYICMDELGFVARTRPNFPSLQPSNALFLLLNDGYYAPPSVLAAVQAHRQLNQLDGAALVASSSSDPALSLVRAPTHSLAGIAGLVHMRTQLLRAQRQHRQTAAQLNSATQNAGGLSSSSSNAASHTSSLASAEGQLVALKRHNELLAEQLQSLSEIESRLQNDCKSLAPKLLTRAKHLSELETHLTRHQRQLAEQTFRLRARTRILSTVQKQVVLRRGELFRELSQVYPIQPRRAGTQMLGVSSSSASAGKSSAIVHYPATPPPATNSAETGSGTDGAIVSAGALSVALCICGFYLPNSEFANCNERETSAALGYVCAVVDTAARWLSQPLRYALVPVGSRSYVLHPPDQPDSLSARYPLYVRGAERRRFEEAVFFLNKNIEQLIHSQGWSLPTHSLRVTLFNLHFLLHRCGRQPWERSHIAQAARRASMTGLNAFVGTDTGSADPRRATPSGGRSRTLSTASAHTPIEPSPSVRNTRTRSRSSLVTPTSVASAQRGMLSPHLDTVPSSPSFRSHSRV